MKRTVTALLLVLANTNLASELLVQLDKTPIINDLSKQYPVFTWNESAETPNGPLAVSYMMIDLNNKAYEPVVMASDDPDGEGPSEAVLTKPIEIMKKFNAFAAINANAFARTSNSDQEPGWHKGLYVDMIGLVVSDGVVRSCLIKYDENTLPEATSRYSFWFDKKNVPYLGQPDEKQNISQAVGDWFSPLLIDGTIFPEKDKDKARHPRSAIGVDKQKRFLTLAVVDGRREGYSIGINLFDLAELLKSKGCYNAINLDGGGSSIMLYKDKDEIKTANKPSDNTHRAIPVMFGIREHSEK